MVALPVAVGAYAWHTPARRAVRPAPAAHRLRLVPDHAGGVDQESCSTASAGCPGWVLEVRLIYLVLSFPTGRITERVDRALVWAGVGLVGAAVPALRAAQRRATPSPSPVVELRSRVSGQRVHGVGVEPAWVDGAVRPLRETLTLLLFGAVLVRLAVAGAPRHAAPAPHAQPGAGWSRSSAWPRWWRRSWPGRRAPARLWPRRWPGWPRSRSRRWRRASGSA